MPFQVKNATNLIKAKRGSEVVSNEKCQHCLVKHSAEESMLVWKLKSDLRIRKNSIEELRNQLGKCNHYLLLLELNNIYQL